MYYLYLLECNDQTCYVGVTNDINRRFLEHKKGFNNKCYTYSRRPVKLVSYLVFEKMSQAIWYEKKLKKWSKAKKMAFFKKEYDKLHELARCRNESSSKKFGKSLKQ